MHRESTNQIIQIKNVDIFISTMQVAKEMRLKLKLCKLKTLKKNLYMHLKM